MLLTPSMPCVTGCAAAAQGLTGAIHETGHALYEQGRNLEYDGLPVNEVPPRCLAATLLENLTRGGGAAASCSCPPADTVSSAQRRASSASCAGSLGGRAARRALAVPARARRVHRRGVSEAYPHRPPDACRSLSGVRALLGPRGAARPALSAARRAARRRCRWACTSRSRCCGSAWSRWAARSRATWRPSSQRPSRSCPRS